MFNFACNKIDSASASHAFEIGVNDVYGNSATVSMNTFGLLMDGSEFGDSGSCYIPIFKNGQGNQYVVTYGQIFLNKNYMVFDATPATEQHLFTNAIMFGSSQQIGLDLQKATDKPNANKTTPVDPIPTPTPVAPVCSNKADPYAPPAVSDNSEIIAH